MNPTPRDRFINMITEPVFYVWLFAVAVTLVVYLRHDITANEFIGYFTGLSAAFKIAFGLLNQSGGTASLTAITHARMTREASKKRPQFPPPPDPPSDPTAPAFGDGAYSFHPPKGVV